MVCLSIFQPGFPTLAIFCDDQLLVADRNPPGWSRPGAQPLLCKMGLGRCLMVAAHILKV